MNKSIWITGASSGIGWATALEAGKRGYRLALTARRTERLESLKQELINNGANFADIIIAPADVTNAEELKKAYQKIKENFAQVDILFANAGSSSNTEKFEVAKFKEVFDLNFFGVLNCIEIVLPEMQARKTGHIVGVSSVAGYNALPRAAIYGASKSALTYFLESIRFSVEKDNIFVTVVSPGFVKSELTDKNNFYMPFIMQADRAALKIMNGIERRNYEIHFPKYFTYFLKFLRLLPQPCYHFLISKLST